MKMSIYGQFVYNANMKVGYTSNTSIKKNATCVRGHKVILMHAETRTSTLKEAVHGGKRGHEARSGRTTWNPQEEAADSPPSRVAQEVG